MSTLMDFDVTSYARGGEQRRVFFAGLNDEDLRKFATADSAGNWQEWSRAQILALLHNRYPEGYYIEIYDPPEMFEATRKLMEQSPLQGEASGL